MTLRSILSSCTLFWIASAIASADPVAIQDGSTANWQNWNPSVLAASLPSGTVRPYWDNSSWDGGYIKNVGACLASAAYCGLANAPGVLPYLGTPDGRFYSNFYFDSDGHPKPAVMQIQIAADSGSSSLAWYDINNPAQYHVLFSGNTPRGATIDFTPSAEYGFVFVDTAAGVTRTYFTQSGLQGKDKNFQHFAVFEQQSDGAYYLGIEDRPSDGSDLDYKDMIVRIGTASSPEDPTLALLGIGLLLVGGIGIVRHKRAKS